jgi:flagellar assembly protein FliH
MNPSVLDDAVVTRFELPDVDGIVLSRLTASGALQTARQVEDELAALSREAHAEGYARGYAEGRAAGEQAAASDMRARLSSFDAMLAQLSAPLAAFDQALVEDIAQLALLIARHLVRRELKTAPGEVVGVVRETMRLLPLASQGTSVRLHPDDVELVRGAFAASEEPIAWRLEADPLITRGGCVVDSASSHIDATVEARLAAIASKMFGGERDSDRADDGHA